MLKIFFKPKDATPSPFNIRELGIALKNNFQEPLPETLQNFSGITILINLCFGLLERRSIAEKLLNMDSATLSVYEQAMNEIISEKKIDPPPETKRQR